MYVVIGSTVKIKNCQQYRGVYKGEIGEVARTYKEMYGVKFEGLANFNSSYGVFWFRASQIEFITEKTIESEDDFIMMENYKRVGVSFPERDTGGYVYALYQDDVEVDDTVVVNTGHHGLAVAKIVTLDDSKLGKVRYNREVVCKVDLTAYEERKQRMARAAELKQAMDAKVKEMQNQAIYEMLSEKDPALKAMFDEYKTLLN